MYSYHRKKKLNKPIAYSTVLLCLTLWSPKCVWDFIHWSVLPYIQAPSQIGHRLKISRAPFLGALSFDVMACRTQRPICIGLLFNYEPGNKHSRQPGNETRRLKYESSQWGSFFWHGVRAPTSPHLGYILAGSWSVTFFFKSCFKMFYWDHFRCLQDKS